MSDYTDTPDDFLDEILADDPANRELASALRNWREDNRGDEVVPDGRLAAMFAREPAEAPPSRLRQWMQRPTIAFAASFAVVLALGVGALALVAANSGGDIVATASTSTFAAAESDEAASAQITLPSDLSEQTGYLSCVAGLLGDWFESGLTAASAPRIVDDCGTPPIPDLGPEAEAYREALQEWANCIAGEAQDLLPGLAELLQDRDDTVDFETDCGAAPDPRDFGLELPFLDWDWENIDPSEFSFGPWQFGEFNLENFDLDGLLDGLPEGLLPEGFDPEQWKEQFGDFNFEDFDFKECVPDDESREGLPDISGLEDLSNLDLAPFFSVLEDCGFGFLDFGNLGDLQLGDLPLGDLDFDALLERLGSKLGNLDIEGLDLEKLFSDWYGDEPPDFSSFFNDSADPAA